MREHPQVELTELIGHTRFIWVSGEAISSLIVLFCGVAIVLERWFHRLKSTTTVTEVAIAAVPRANLSSGRICVRLVAARGNAIVVYCKQTNVAGERPDARKVGFVRRFAPSLA